MMKEKTLFVLGIWIFCLPYLGFPVFWKNLLFVATGLFVCMLAYLMYRHKKVLLKIIDGNNDGDDEPVKNTINASFEPEIEKEKIVFKSEYNPAEESEAPKVSPYSATRDTFKTFYEEKSGPLIHRVSGNHDVDTVKPRIKVVRRKKISDDKLETTSSIAE
ncbi:MAG: hypothetical protein KBC42_00445 [Candidatus Pacebacteria bacterium]|nr:hypothetical protein [Candidatus Paceibacterota bacterium]MBP9780376.1 hypothetical protein [Candidatus Paceibacterota bacterium]